MPSFVPTVPSEPVETNQDHAAVSRRFVPLKSSTLWAIVTGLVVVGVIALAVYRYVRPTPTRASCCHVSMTAPANAPIDHERAA